MKGCLTEKEFNLFLEDSLTPPRIKAFEAHIEGCDKCRKEYASWKALKDSLSTASEISMPLNFKDNVMSRISKEKIRPAASGVIRRTAAVAFVSIILLYYIIKPVLGPYMDAILSNLFKTMSINLYGALQLVGIDPSVLITLFGEIMKNINTLLPVFAISTFFMIASFTVIILRGKASGRHEA